MPWFEKRVDRAGAGALGTVGTMHNHAQRMPSQGRFPITCSMVGISLDAASCRISNRAMWSRRKM